MESHELQSVIRKLLVISYQLWELLRMKDLVARNQSERAHFMSQIANNVGTHSLVIDKISRRAEHGVYHQGDVLFVCIQKIHFVAC